MDYNLPGFSVHGISQLRKLEWVAISFSKRSSQPRDRTCVPCVVGGLYCWATAETIAAEWEINNSVQLVQFSRSVVSDSLRPHELQHARPPCPSVTPGVYPNSCPLTQWCHPAISSSVVLFSSCPQSLPASESFPMSLLFTWGGQSFGVSALASVLPMNTQD